MFTNLSDAIDGLSIPVDGTALLAAVALRDRLDAKIAEATSAFDEAQLWDLDGATSALAWFRHRSALSARDCAHLVARTRKLRHLPATAKAWSEATLSGGQVDAILASVDGASLELFADHEARIIPMIAGFTAADTVHVMRHWKARAVAEVERPFPIEHERALHLSETLDGVRILNGTLDAESGVIVERAVRQATVDDLEGEPVRTPAQRRADAMTDVCRFYLDHHEAPAGRRNRPHVNVILDIDAWEAGGGSTVVDGPSLDRVATETTVCDCIVHRTVMRGRSAVLDYGTGTRTIPTPLWNALVVRDQHCRFPGCDRRPDWCEGHHVVPVNERGPTAIGNLALLCSRHHHRLHQPGWRATLDRDATLHITDDRNQHRSSRPPGALAVTLALAT